MVFPVGRHDEDVGGVEARRKKAGEDRQKKVAGCEPEGGEGVDCFVVASCLVSWYGIVRLDEMRWGEAEKKEQLTGNENRIPSFTGFGNVGFEAGVDLVGRPGQEEPEEGEEVESHAWLPGNNTMRIYRWLRELLIASIKQVEEGKWFFEKM